MKRLATTHGLPLVVYYVIFNKACVVLVTVALQMGWLGAGDIITLINYLGIDYFIRGLDGVMDRPAFSIGMLHITGRLVANYALAVLFMSLWTPLQIDRKD